MDNVNDDLIAEIRKKTNAPDPFEKPREIHNGELIDELGFTIVQGSGQIITNVDESDIEKFAPNSNKPFADFLNVKFKE